jgi:hypothetical protein
MSSESPHPINFLLFTPSFDRPYMLRQCVLNIKNQSYSNFHHSIAINRNPTTSGNYDDWNMDYGQNELEYQELLNDVVDERWTINYYENSDQHVNYLRALKQVDIDDYDYFVKIDDDEIHKRGYLASIAEYISANDDFNVFTSKVSLKLNNCYLERNGPWGNLGAVPHEVGLPGTMVLDRIAIRDVIEMPTSEWEQGCFEDTAWLNYLYEKKKRTFVSGPPQSNFIWHIHGGYGAGTPNISTSGWARNYNGYKR